MKKPIIALTPSYDLEGDFLRMNPTYTDAVSAAGGTPVILPLTLSDEELQAVAGLFDGFLFTGGPDVNPLIFGEETRAGCGAVSSLRDDLELRLFPELVKADKPVLGICRGIQVMNIAMGGDIYQDICSQYSTTQQHSQASKSSVASHHICPQAGTLLWDILKKDRVAVNSHHHQAVRALGKGFQADAYAQDRLIEAISMPGKKFILGVQWHPEGLWKHDADSAAIFQAFIRAAALNCSSAGRAE